MIPAWAIPRARTHGKGMAAAAAAPNKAKALIALHNVSVSHRVIVLLVKQ
jgi:hypothetical protein